MQHDVRSGRNIHTTPLKRFLFSARCKGLVLKVHCLNDVDKQNPSSCSGSPVDGYDCVSMDSTAAEAYKYQYEQVSCVSLILKSLYTRLHFQKTTRIVKKSV